MAELIKKLRIVPWQPRAQRKEPQFLSPEGIRAHAESRPESDDDEIFSADIERDEHGQPCNRFYNRARVTDRTIDELIGICKGVIADGAVTTEEARFLAQWMAANRESAAQWPAKILYHRLSEMLVDQTLDPAEQAELLELLRQITGSDGPTNTSLANRSSSLPLTRPAPEIHFDDRFFCLTGKLESIHNNRGTGYATTSFTLEI